LVLRDWRFKERLGPAQFLNSRYRKKGDGESLSSAKNKSIGGKEYISFDEKGLCVVIKDASGATIEEKHFEIPDWEQITLEEKASVASDLQEMITREAQRSGVPIEIKRKSRQEKRRLEREFGVSGSSVEVVLASMLRNRQLEKAEQMVPKLNETGDTITVSEYKAQVESCSNREIISSYLVCADCGNEFISYHDAVEIAKHSKNIDEWFSNIDSARSEHEI
jgi:hypothetical protein